MHKREREMSNESEWESKDNERERRITRVRYTKG